MTYCVAEKCVHAGCQRTSQTITNLVALQSLMHLPRDADGEQVLQCIFTQDETRFNHATSKIKTVSMMGRHPFSPPAKKFKATSSAKKKITATFWDYKCVLFVYLLTCADTVTAEVCCGTLERLWHVAAPSIHHFPR